MKLPKNHIFAEKYKILKELDSGGFSDVYLAEDVTLEVPQKIAIKLFELKVGDGERRECMALFLREAYCLSKLNHPNIIQILDFGQRNQFYYIATEFLEGTTLYDIVETTGAMPEAEVAMVAYEIVKALKFLHSHKVVHRDIKPINIMVDGQGDIKLIDFGLSKLINESTVSRKGIFTGTPQYAAPECITQEEFIDWKADIFSLGASCYFFLTKAEPFSGDSPHEVYKNRFTEIPKPIEEINSSLNPKMVKLVNKMISIDRNERPSIEELKSTLFKFISKS